MTRAKPRTIATQASVADAIADGSDGRRQRSERSREQIVEALFALIRAGDMAPRAAAVADAAGVSLRTVFRHFEDMESLYRVMAERMEAELMPIVLAPFEAQDWRGRLSELVSRRADIYERVLPLRVAASLRRFQSSFLMDDYRRFLRLERTGLRSILPAVIVADRTLFSALEMVTGFQAWRRMRQDQGLSPAETEAVTRAIVERLVDGR
jgi:AcrR family transcriptional regulator